jgi:uncharacterized protein YegP (UPF0339 family)
MATKKRKGSIVVWKSAKNHKFYFHLLSSNGKIILPAGQGYNRRNDLIKTLQAVSDIFTEKRFVIIDKTGLKAVPHA